jgi:glutamine amidotransferase
MRTLETSGQADAIRAKCADLKTPFLGICLGAQLLLERGSEGAQDGNLTRGLGLIKGDCTKMCDVAPDGTKLKLPHVGWNQIELTGDNKLFNDLQNRTYFYFTHSYMCVPSDNTNILAYTEYGSCFASAIYAGNVFGLQFHPEKSSDAGMQVLKNFVQIVRDHATS